MTGHHAVGERGPPQANGRANVRTAICPTLADLPPKSGSAIASMRLSKVEHAVSKGGFPALYPAGAIITITLRYERRAFNNKHSSSVDFGSVLSERQIFAMKHTAGIIAAAPVAMKKENSENPINPCASSFCIQPATTHFRMQSKPNTCL